MNNINIEFNKFVSKEIEDFAKENLVQHAIDQIGYSGDIKPYSFVIKDEKDEIIGVLTGKIFFGNLHIKELVVDKEKRKGGLGSLLMNKAIEYAKEQKCNFVYLETLNFQALDFYKKFGFYVELERKGFANNCIIYYLRKDVEK